MFHCLCPLPASRKGLRLPLRFALFGEGGRDWRPWVTSIASIGTLLSRTGGARSSLVAAHFSLGWEAGVQRQAQSSLLAEHFSLGRAAAGHQRQSHLVEPI